MFEFIKFELKYRLQRPVTYIYFAILLILAFISTSTDIVRAGGSGGKVMENAPVAIAVIMGTFCIFGLFIISAVMGVPVLRDFQHHTSSMIFSTPIRKIQYLSGKFIGSFIIMLLIMSGLLWGAMLGQVIPWPWHDYTDKLMPFSFMTYWNPFYVIIIPNLFILSAIFFTGGAIGKRLVVVYAQGILLFMGYLVASQFLSEMGNRDLAAVIDPFGFGALAVTTQYWTVSEQNTLLLEFKGIMLQNRLIWMAIGIASLLFTYFRFSVLTSEGGSRGKTSSDTDETVSDIPPVSPSFDLRSQLLQILSLSQFYMRWILKQGPFLFITLAGVILVFVLAFVSGTSAYDIDLHMTSSRTVGLIVNAFSLFFVIIVVFYTGEIVWKERDIRMDQIYDALPYPNYVILTSKFIGMVLMAAILLAFLMVSGLIIQVIKGYPIIEWNIYFTRLFVDTLALMTLYIILGLFIQVVINHKFLGFGLMFIFYVSFIVLDELGVEHNMFYFARANLGTYSEMNRFGHYVTPFSWFNVYWFGLAGVFYATAILLAVRGLETRWLTRIRIGKLRLNRQAAASIIGSLFIFAVSGAFIFYNANVLNVYRNSDEQLGLQADYEKTLKPYEFLIQPRITDTYVDVDIYPSSRDFAASGYYILKNKSDQVIDEIHIQKSTNYQVSTFLEFDKDVQRKQEFEKYNYHIFALSRPLMPGDVLRMDFEVTFTTIVFRESGSNTDVIFNGTFFNNTQYFPSIGYNSRFEISDDDDRKENDLEVTERMLDRDDPRGIAQSLFGDDADKIRFEIVVSTDSTQIAIAPGYLQKKWNDGSRVYYHYKMDTPMVNFYSIVSADYEVVSDTWDPPSDTLPQVNLEIYYHRGHEYNLERMMKGMKESLTYYTKNFSPYQFRQLRIMEFPQYRTFAQSFANTVPFSEGIGFIQNVSVDDVDLPFYVTAHEVAHQWWGHQVTEAGVKGNAMLSETLSQYSALMVMKKHYPDEIIREFLRHELDSYLQGRTFETKKEMPLEEVEGQGYIHYRKGSLIMYALQDYIGEENINRALRKFIRDWGFKDAPYPTSADLISYYKEVTPDSLLYLYDDFFATITLFENKALEATYEISEDSSYSIHLKVEAVKYTADSLGVETKVPLDDWIDIGIFTEGEDGKDKLIYLQKHKIDQEENEFDITVDVLPKKAGIDPINKLIDRNPRDNVREMEEAGDKE